MVDMTSWRAFYGDGIVKVIPSVLIDQTSRSNPWFYFGGGWEGVVGSLVEKDLRIG